jgi:hypothetical protein
MLAWLASTIVGDLANPPSYWPAMGFPRSRPMVSC